MQKTKIKKNIHVLSLIFRLFLLFLLLFTDLLLTSLCAGCGGLST